MLSHVVLPLLACFVGWLALVIAGRRERIRRANEPTFVEIVSSLRGRVRHLLITVAGGYIAFVVSIGGYAILAGELHSGMLGDAVRQGAFLAFAVAVPVFAVANVIVHARHDRRRGDGAPSG